MTTTRRGPVARAGRDLPTLALGRFAISVRMGLLFATLFLLGLALMGAVTYVELGRSIRGGVDAALVAATEEIGDELPDATDADERRVGDVTSTEVESQTLDRAGRVLDASTDDLDERSLLTAAQVRSVLQGEELFTDTSRTDEPMRVLATATDSADPAVLVVAAELDSLTEFREAYLGVVIPLAAASVVLAGLAGWLVSRRALRPVAQMTNEANELGDGRLDLRLAVPPTDDELSDLARTLNAMLDRLQQAVQRERDFTADASHELRTPLAILRAELELSLAATGDEHMRGSLKSALEECDRLQGLTDDLLLIARAEADQIGGTVPIDLGDLSDAVLQRFQALATPRQISLERRGEGVIAGDPRAVERALSNLVENALRYVGPMGHVTVEISQVEEGVRLSVTDDGPGISSHTPEDLVTRFARIDDPHSGAAGLGLAIVSAVAKLHDGHVTFEQPAVSGLRVTIVLPSAPTTRPSRRA